jgi:transcriptional regulator with XRE-family HTH domain
MLMGDLIKLHRERLGLTQDELGQRVGISRQAVQQWEANKTGPQRKVVPKLAVALGIDVAVLNPLLGATVEIALLPGEHHAVPHYVLAELSLLTIDVAGQFLWPKVASTVPVSEDLATAKAVTITDDLMAPDYSPGDLILIDHSVDPQTNDDIVIRVQDGPALLRRYVDRGRNRAGMKVFDLVTPNAESATITLSEADKFVIIGTVIETRRRRKR